MQITGMKKKFVVLRINTFVKNVLRSFTQVSVIQTYVLSQKAALKEVVQMFYKSHNLV